jgi:uncharacterized delta-60 repeat protein
MSDPQYNLIAALPHHRLSRSKVIPATVLLLLLVLTSVVFANDTSPRVYAANSGDFDTTFGNGGGVIIDFGSLGDYANDMLIQPDGKIVVAGKMFNGANDDFALARLNPNGSLDTTFGGTGKVVTNFAIGSFDEIKAIVRDASGRIIAAGVTDANGGKKNFGLARYNINGTLDTTFDGDGLLVTDFFGEDEGIEDVTLDGSGRIVAAGYSFAYNASKYRGFAVARYTITGALDTTFNGTGIRGFGMGTVLGNQEKAYRVVVDGNGRILLAGGGNSYGHVLAMARLNADGSFDTSFADEGRTYSIYTGTDTAYALKMDGAGRIMTGGKESSRASLRRYNYSGVYDDGFDDGDDDGFIGTDFGDGDDILYDMAIDGSARIVTVGQQGSSGNYQIPHGLIARFLPSGLLDASYGSAGSSYYYYGNVANETIAKAVSLDAQGKIVVAGYYIDAATDNANMTVTRFHSVTTVPPTPTNTPVPPTVELLQNGGFESEIGIFGHWQGKNLTDDKRVVNKNGKQKAFIGLGAFQFEGGPDEKSSISQSVTTQGNAGDVLMLSGYVEGKKVVGSGQVKVKVKYLNGTKGKIVFNIPAGTYPYSGFAPGPLSLAGTTSSIKVQAGYKGGSGRIRLDQLSLLKTSASARSDELLGLP